MLSRDEKKKVLKRRFYNYSRLRKKALIIEHEIHTLPTVVSSGRWLVKIDTGRHPSPTEWHLEAKLRLEALLSRVKAAMEPVAEFEKYLSDTHPDLFDFFDLRFNQGASYEQIEEALHISRRTAFRRMERLLDCAIQFCDFQVVENMALNT